MYIIDRPRKGEPELPESCEEEFLLTNSLVIPLKEFFQNN
jgi:hypothetical protein